MKAIAKLRQLLLHPSPQNFRICNEVIWTLQPPQRELCLSYIENHLHEWPYDCRFLYLDEQRINVYKSPLLPYAQKLAIKPFHAEPLLLTELPLLTFREPIRSLVLLDDKEPFDDEELERVLSLDCFSQLQELAFDPKLIKQPHELFQRIDCYRSLRKVELYAEVDSGPSSAGRYYTHYPIAFLKLRTKEIPFEVVPEPYNSGMYVHFRGDASPQFLVNPQPQYKEVVGMTKVLPTKPSFENVPLFYFFSVCFFCFLMYAWPKEWQLLSFISLLFYGFATYHLIQKWRGSS